MKPRPTALLCLSDVLAMGALFEAPRQGLSVPDDLSVMGFDDLDWTPHIEPALSVVHLPTREMGQATGEALVQYLDEGKPIDSIELKGHLLERRSTARRCGRVGSARKKREKGVRGGLTTFLTFIFPSLVTGNRHAEAAGMACSLQFLDIEVDSFLHRVPRGEESVCARRSLRPSRVEPERLHAGRALVVD